MAFLKELFEEKINIKIIFILITKKVLLKK